MYLNTMRLITLCELFVVIIWFLYLFRKGELQQNSNKSSFISVSFCCVNLPSKTKLLQIRPHNAFNWPTRTVNIQCFCATHTLLKLTAHDILVKFSTYNNNFNLEVWPWIMILKMFTWYIAKRKQTIFILL